MLLKGTAVREVALEDGNQVIVDISVEGSIIEAAQDDTNPTKVIDTLKNPDDTRIAIERPLQDTFRVVPVSFEDVLV